MFQICFCVVSIEYTFTVGMPAEKEDGGLWDAEDEDVADSWDADEVDVTCTWDKSGAKDHLGKK